MKRRIFAALIALLLIGALTAAAHEVPDLTENGTITFRLDWNGEPLSGGSLSMYRIGDIVENDGNYSFAPVAELPENISLEDPDDPALAAELAAAAANAGLTAITAPIEAGTAYFDSVAPGLYVVVQEDPADGFAALRPFLISMPKYENGHYETNITADPKVSLEPAPTEPSQPTPTEPDDPRLPQTGQLNWPVPILGVSGLALFVAGCFLRFGKRKETNEK